MKKLLILFFILLSFNSIVLAEMPEPIVKDNSHWEVTQDTEADYFGFEFDKNKQQTQICVLSETATKLNNLPIHYTYTNLETNKTEQLNRKKVKQTDSGLNKDYYGFCRNFKTEKRIKFGNNSIIYQWINSTLYIYKTDTFEVNPFSIQVLCNDEMIEAPNINWTSYDSTPNEGIKFSADINIDCNGKLTFRQNKLEEVKTTNSFFLENEWRSYINYDDFKSSKGNSFELINNTIIQDEENIFHSRFKCLYLAEFSYEAYDYCRNNPYAIDTNYYGNFTDLDPGLQITFSSSTQIIYTNRTEATPLGVRTDAPVLFMDFDKPAEGTYVQDNSIYNNYGTNVGATYNSSCGTTSAGNDLGGCYEFDGVDDYISVDDSNDLDIGTNDFSIASWINLKDTLTSGIVTKYDNSASCSDSNRGYSFFTVDGGLRLIICGSSATAVTATSGDSDFSTDEWVHAVVIADREGSATFYANGINIGSTSISGESGTLAGTETLDLGRITNNWYLKGSIDEVLIWDRALSASEVLNLYNGTKNNSNYIGKYAKDGDFKSLVFYNETSTYWNTTLSLADSDGSGTWNDYDEGLVSYWKFNADGAKDYAGDNDGTLVNDVANTTGHIGGGYEFDGDGDYVDVADFGNYTSFTFASWYKSNSSNIQGIVNTGNCPGYYNTIYQNDMQWFDGTSYVSAGYVTDNKWHYLVWSYNGTSMSQYIDGTFKREDFGGWSQGTGCQITKIGVASGTRYVNGSIDDVKIYNRALSADEVSDMYNRTNDKYFGEGLVSYWALDENFLDSVGGNDGTPSGDIVNATGLSSGAMMFDGDGDYVATSANVSDYNFTISVWIKPSASCDNGKIIGGDNSVSLWILANKINLYEDSSNYLYSSSNPCDGEWHLVTAIFKYNVSNSNLYIDGVLNEGSSVTFGVPDSVPPAFYIGAQSGGANEFNGSIDEVLIYNKSLTASEVTELYKAGLSQHANANVTLETRTATSYNISDAGLVGLWGLNGDANDELGVNNGTWSGTENYIDESGVVGKGGEFEGTNSYITLSNTEGLVDPNNAFTISAWTKLSSNSAYDRVYAQGGTFSGNTIFDISTDNTNKFRMYLRNDAGSSTVVYSEVSNLHEWYHIVITYDGSTNYYLYRNGVEEDTDGTGDIGTCTFNFSTIGVLRRTSLSYPFHGSIDEVRIYNRSLSADEIQNLYELGSYHIEWGDWTEEQKVEDGVPTTSTNLGNFMQYKAVYNTDDTDVSAYVLNVSIEDVKVIIGSNPYFIFIPNNISLEYKVDSLSTYFTGTGDNAINYTINDTSYFAINQSGNLTNTSNIPIGEYYIEVTITDTINLLTNSTLFNVNVSDTIGTIVTLIYPIENNARDNWTTFVYQVADANTIMNATLYIDGVANETITSPAKNTNLYFNTFFGTEGFYSYTITSSDSTGNTGTATSNFTVDDNPWEINGKLAFNEETGKFIIRNI